MPLEAALAGDEFAWLMSRLQPFEPAPLLAVAVSGGADSMCLCLLAVDWARARGGRALALIVDHGLRPEAAEEARLTCDRLAASGIAACVLGVSGLRHGPALAARAREARFDALLRSCAERGVLHLLLGHHAGDQAETRLIRVQSRSGAAGLACMAALRETGRARVLRPLLGVAPERLRATLRARAVGWVEDPSNQDGGALRVRLRSAARADRHALCAGARVDGDARARSEAAVAAELAEATLRPEGFAVVERPALSPQAWSALIQTIGGAAYPPAGDAVARLSERSDPCTLGGVRIARAGRLGPGLVVMREAAAMAAPAAARDGSLWDGRFRVSGDIGRDATVGGVGEDASRLRKRSDLPAAVLRTLPAIRVRGELEAVPHIGWRSGEASPNDVRVTFDPPRAAACTPFVTQP